MGNYIKKYNLGTIKVDLPYARHIHTLPLLSFKDFRGGVDLSLVYNRGLLNKGYDFYLPECYKLNIQKKIGINYVSYKPTQFIDSDGTVITLIDNNNNIYTFDDESQRIMRPVTGGYEVEYSDFSKEIYDENGNILRYIDKYGDEVLTYAYENNLLMALIYRDNKVVEFWYDYDYNVNFYRLTNIIYNDTNTIIECTTNDVDIKHYSGILYKTYMIHNSTTNSKTYYVKACNQETPTVILYSKECIYKNNNIQLLYKEGTSEIDSLTYKFTSNVINYSGPYNRSEVINKKGLVKRLYFNDKKLLYEHEVISTEENDNQDSDDMFYGNVFTGNVKIYNTIDNLNIKNPQINLTKNDISGFSVDTLSSGFFKFIFTNYSNAKGYYLLTGWIKKDSDIGNSVNFKITDSDYYTEEVDFSVGLSESNKWYFFAYKFYTTNNNCYLVHNAFTNIEFKDLRVTYQATSVLVNNRINYSLQEDVLINNGRLDAREDYVIIPFKDVSFVDQGNTNEIIANITYDDVLKYKIKVLREGSSNEIYSNNLKTVTKPITELKFLYNDVIYNLSDYSIGKRFFNMGKEYWNYARVYTDNIKLQKMVNYTIGDYQILNTNLDVIRNVEDGKTTNYEMDKGLVISQSVANHPTLTLNYNYVSDNDNCKIEVTDEFGEITTYFYDNEWGENYKIIFPNGEIIEDTLSDDKTVITKREFVDTTNSIVHEIDYDKGRISSLYTDSLKYGFSYLNGELSLVEKYQNNTSIPKYSILEKTHTDFSDSNNFAGLYSIVYNYDKYNRLNSITDVLENIYKNFNMDDDTTPNENANLIRQNDLITDVSSDYTYDENTNNIKTIIKKDSDENILSEEYYTYDSANRLVGRQYSYLASNNTYNNILFGITYQKNVTDDIVNNRILQTYYGLDQTTLATINYSYDNLKRISNKNTSLYGYAFNKSFTYDKSRISKEELNSLNVTNYSYDSCGRVNVISSNAGNIIYHYDTQGRLVREDNQLLDKTYTYEYNEIGNIVSKKTYNYTTIDILSDATSTINYSYDSENTDRLISYGNKTLSYNILGYPTTYNGYNLTWNKDKLVSMSKGDQFNGFQSYTFTYNALGQRIGKIYSRTIGTEGITSIASNDIINSITTYEYDIQGRLLFEITNITYYSDGYGQKKIEYIYDQNSIIGIRYTHGTSSELYYFNRNIFGDVTEIYDTSGAQVAKYAYDAYGNCTIKQYTNYEVANKNPIRYRGYYYDVETGLAMVGQRYYSPELCRFIQPAEISTLNPHSINGLNLYAYANNNPIVNIHGSINLGLGAINSKKTNILNDLVIGRNIYSNNYPDLSFLSTGFSFVENAFSTFAGAVDGYRKIEKLDKISGLEKASNILMWIGIGLNISLSAYESFLVNKSQSGPQKWGNFIGDVAYIAASSAITYGVGYLVGMIPYAGPFLAAPVSIFVGTLLDQIWSGEEVLWINGANISVKGKSLEEWFKDLLTEWFGG